MRRRYTITLEITLRLEAHTMSWHSRVLCGPTTPKLRASLPLHHCRNQIRRKQKQRPRQFKRLGRAFPRGAHPRRWWYRERYWSLAPRRSRTSQKTPRVCGTPPLRLLSISLLSLPKKMSDEARFTMEWRVPIITAHLRFFWTIS